jgi:hypothetical protein
MAHAVLIQNQVAAKDVAAYNRSVVSGSDANNIDNGNVFWLQAQGTSGSASEVWTAVIPTTGSLTGLWMAASPDTLVSTYDGSLTYRGLNQDPRNFYNKGGMVFDAFKPQVGDVITLTGDAFTGSAESTFAGATTAAYTLTWASTIAASAFTLRYLATKYISIGSGGIDNQRVAAYKFEVLVN